MIDTQLPTPTRNPNHALTRHPRNSWHTNHNPPGVRPHRILSHPSCPLGGPNRSAHVSAALATVEAMNMRTHARTRPSPCTKPGCDHSFTPGDSSKGGEFYLFLPPKAKEERYRHAIMSDQSHVIPSNLNIVRKGAQGMHPFLL